ncbi:bifunctional diguanylate cyclase/phosphodiesterase [Jannaschia aquimarina]|uniref:Cph2_1 protein n=1 Tax=Jannaschia aquimarina TaxID=935700 RepID=A0A0D1CQL6_9RHOB|nr:bifunctional diguanylate cyclase/phosphodiesterase [Jannaschia aquimarina]KIT17077.1 Phytochrome-like protein cph2 [Jannaschia aquimarina]SNS46259.1 diguanylate cyclase (GGDEF) domain-containing protein [Jannaschia aquimarina]
MPDALILVFAVVVSASLGYLVARRRSRRPDPVAATDRLVSVPLPGRTASRPGSLILLDVDAMGALNEVHGYDAGDRLLERIADALRRGLPPGAGQERLDGGRFLLWLPEVDADQALDLSRRLRAHIREVTIEVGDVRLARTISAGIVPVSGEEGRSRAILHADDALRRAKEIGGNSVQLGAVRGGPPRMPSAEEVTTAIRDGLLSYYVQPIFDLNTGQPAGVEALIRWVDAEGRIVRSPDDFLPLLERLPEDVTDTLVGMAERAALPFVTGPRPLYIAFNATAGALERRDSLARKWFRELRKRIPADRIVIELLESAVLLDPESAARTLRIAQSLGIRIALDDFGTGLSNLDRIVQFRPDLIKLDRVFMNGLGEGGPADAVVSATARLAKDLNISVVAEGIETPADAEIMRQAGVTLGQGYMLGRPAPPEDWAKRLKNIG